ncbi:MAG: hypothetical protein WBZ07_00995 [Candidatus Dormiibacterota bacterium]
MADVRTRRGAVTRRLAKGFGGVFLGAILTLTLPGLLAAPVFAQTPGSGTGYNEELVSLTNNDRTSNGLAALAENGALDDIGESGDYGGCSRPIYGRADDMITNDYFSHVIPGCSADGGYVWPIMSAYGVDFSSAGENVGWNSGYADPAAGVNTQFMDSAPHRANILGAFDELGVGSWYTSSSWNYPGSGGGPWTGVYMFAEEFAQVGGYTPPPSSGGGGGGGGGGTAPSPPATPAPTPVPTPTPTPKPPPPGVGSKSPKLAQGLLSSTIDQVISSYLDE